MSSVLNSTVDDLGDCELCIIGAGYAGLNGLNAAAKYLKKGDRVVIFDKQASWGGQWMHQYDFVRLHQPYRMFTAGDQPWTLERDAAHLATRREILDHLSSVPGVSAGHLEVRALFGHAYRDHRVRNGRVEVEAQQLTAGKEPARTVRVRARRLLKATGLDIESLAPFKLSSSRVRSVAVSDPVLMTPEFLESSAPVYIIGSGKTAMDAILHVAQSSPSRRSLHVILGSGMWFFVREHQYPRGIERYYRGSLVGDELCQISERFDGRNEAELTHELQRAGILHSVFESAENCRLAILSLAERAQIVRATSEVHRGHLIDVDGKHMTVRDGTRLRDVPVADGSWFINCTSHLRPLPHEAILQDSGLVCAPQAGLGFSGNTAYFLTHLWYRDQLGALAPELFRCRLDVAPKLRLLPHFAVMTMANAALTLPRLPFSIPARFLGDYNKWYPLHRQLLLLARMQTKRSDLIRKAERVLQLRFSDSPDLTTARPTHDAGEANAQHHREPVDLAEPV